MNNRVYRQNGVLKAQFAYALHAFVLSLGLAMSFSAPVAAQGIRMNEDIISDPLTGAAILGYDPVAFFIEGYAVVGNPANQFIHAGKVWYFASAANKRAFEADPDAYVPAYGGHDAVGIATGAAIHGSPSYFTITGGKVFLFRHAETRELFLKDPAIASAAEKHWPEVKRLLVP